MQLGELFLDDLGTLRGEGDGPGLIGVLCGFEHKSEALMIRHGESFAALHRMRMPLLEVAVCGAEEDQSMFVADLLNGEPSGHILVLLTAVGAVGMIRNIEFQR